MDPNSELSDTAILRITQAADGATARFLAHFTRGLSFRDAQIDIDFCAADFCVVFS